MMTGSSRLIQVLALTIWKLDDCGRILTVLEQDTGVGIDVGVGVLGLAVLGQNAGGNLVDLADKVEHGVVGEVLEGKLALRNVTRVRFAEDGMAVTRDDATGLEGAPEVVLDGLVGKVAADRLLHLDEPVENFLVGTRVRRKTSVGLTQKKQKIETLTVRGEVQQDR